MSHWLFWKSGALIPHFERIRRITITTTRLMPRAIRPCQYSRLSAQIGLASTSDTMAMSLIKMSIDGPVNGKQAQRQISSFSRRQTGTRGDCEGKRLFHSLNLPLTGGVFERIADGIAGDVGRVDRGILGEVLAEVAPLDVLLGIVLGATSVAHHECQHGGGDGRASQNANDALRAEQQPHGDLGRRGRRLVSAAFSLLCVASKLDVSGRTGTRMATQPGMSISTMAACQSCAVG